MPATGGAGSSTAVLLVSASAAALTTISISCCCGGAAGPSGALSREEEEDRTALGPTGGFLSVGGSERWSGGWWPSPAAGSMFSSEQRRLEGEGLEDTWGAAEEEEEESQAARLDRASERGSDSVPLSVGGGLLATPLVSARGLLAAFGLSAIFLCRFSLRARVRSSSFCTHHQVDREVSSG